MIGAVVLTVDLFKQHIISRPSSFIAIVCVCENTFTLYMHVRKGPMTALHFYVQVKSKE